MGEHGGVIINIVADFWKGFPGMRLDKINTNFKKILSLRLITCNALIH